MRLDSGKDLGSQSVVTIESNISTYSQLRTYSSSDLRILLPYPDRGNVRRFVNLLDSHSILSEAGVRQKSGRYTTVTGLL